MVPPPSVSQPRCGNPACGRPIDRQATGRPARYCSGSCRQAARRERLRLAEAERRRAERLGANPAVRDQSHATAAQEAKSLARDHAARQAASFPHEVADTTAPAVTKQVITRTGSRGAADGETGQPISMPVIRGGGDAQGAPLSSGTQTPRAWPSWAWSTA
jgi:hypothetical protein